MAIKACLKTGWDIFFLVNDEDFFLFLKYLQIFIIILYRGKKVSNFINIIWGMVELY